eukprot:gnl/MRDRNA2_/MRDRNA2_66775_c0_seq1.p1 gnl/MRDRNA2_/MRDRNA2_66775_c0~~gnl/MRDRNA2_/MRDRNA2_66775_c0_seq1.p1  ORF type:complete len:359 (+),score=86.94 gnl/MRDRNA2_/MRDRNA2_66775_c0_seq1:71-1147(+)
MMHSLALIFLLECATFFSDAGEADSGLDEEEILLQESERIRQQGKAFKEQTRKEEDEKIGHLAKLLKASKLTPDEIDALALKADQYINPNHYSDQSSGGQQGAGYDDASFDDDQNAQALPPWLRSQKDDDTEDLDADPERLSQHRRVGLSFAQKQAGYDDPSLYDDPYEDDEDFGEADRPRQRTSRDIMARKEYPQPELKKSRFKIRVRWALMAAKLLAKRQIEAEALGSLLNQEEVEAFNISSLRRPDLDVAWQYLNASLEDKEFQEAHSCVQKKIQQKFAEVATSMGAASSAWSRKTLVAQVIDNPLMALAVCGLLIGSAMTCVIANCRCQESCPKLFCSKAWVRAKAMIRGRAVF